MFRLGTHCICLGCLILFSCGYHADRAFTQCDPLTISIPYVQGDVEGRLTDALAVAVNRSGLFQYRQNHGRLKLLARVTGAGDDRVGFRFDRNDLTGKLRKNLIGTENRKSLSVEITVFDTVMDKIVLGPQTVVAQVDYDYVDGSSIRDLSFTDPAGILVPVVSFSLGQLDSRDGATVDALTPLYELLAQKIVDGITVHDCNEE